MGVVAVHGQRVHEGHGEVHPGTPFGLNSTVDSVWSVAWEPFITAPSTSAPAAEQNRAQGIRPAITPRASIRAGSSYRTQ